MIGKTNLIIALALVVLASHGAFSQALLDGFNAGKGKGNISLSYSVEGYEEFYNGDNKVQLENVQNGAFGDNVVVNSINLYANYGILDNLDVVVNLPYITVQGDGDEANAEQETSDLQDINVYLKYTALQTDLGDGVLSILGAAGISTPLSNYEPDVLISIGNQATTFNANAIVQYKTSFGLFGNLQAGYSVRNNDVPNATILSAKLGYAASKFYVDACVFSQISEGDAPDIGEVPLSETRVNFTQVGVNGYYNVGSGFGITLGFGTYVTARNANLSTRFTGGLVYSFGQ